jgi:glycosyltransferase involved in cell wall biosynthesis
MRQTQIPPTLFEPEAIPADEPAQQVAISIVIPVMNEDQNVRPLYEKLTAQLDSLGKSNEVIFVDNGSTDNTFTELMKLHDEFSGVVRVIRFRRNFGMTPALVAGFGRSRGEGVISMDGDLQDDPEEIPRYLEKIAEGYDVV